MEGCLSVAVLLNAVSNRAGSHTARKFSTIAGALFCLSLVLFLVYMQQLCYHFKVLLETVNFRDF